MPEADRLQLQIQESIVTCGHARRAEIALTFDDGPYVPYTLDILDILRFYQVQATFFCLGKNVGQSPEIVERMQKEGHLVENHAWSHRALTEITDPQEVLVELARCTEAIEHVTGIQPTFIRPPYGKYNAQVLSCIQAYHLIPVLWTVDSRDWTSPGPDAIYQNSIEQTSHGSIILLHDGEGDRTGTVEALPRIIEWFQRCHIDLVTLRQLVS